MEKTHNIQALVL